MLDRLTNDYHRRFYVGGKVHGGKSGEKFGLTGAIMKLHEMTLLHEGAGEDLNSILLESGSPGKVRLPMAVRIALPSQRAGVIVF